MDPWQIFNEGLVVFLNFIQTDLNYLELFFFEVDFIIVVLQNVDEWLRYIALNQTKTLPTLLRRTAELPDVLSMDFQTQHSPALCHHRLLSVSKTYSLNSRASFSIEDSLTLEESTI